MHVLSGKYYTDLCCRHGTGDPVTWTWKTTQMAHWPGDPMTQFHVCCADEVCLILWPPLNSVEEVNENVIQHDTLSDEGRQRQCCHFVDQRTSKCWPQSTNTKVTQCRRGRCPVEQPCPEPMKHNRERTGISILVGTRNGLLRLIILASVSLSVTQLRCANRAERIDVLFEMEILAANSNLATMKWWWSLAAARPTQPCIHSGSVNNDQFRLTRQRQAYNYGSFRSWSRDNACNTSALLRWAHLRKSAESRAS